MKLETGLNLSVLAYFYGLSLQIYSTLFWNSFLKSKKKNWIYFWILGIWGEWNFRIDYENVQLTVSSKSHSDEHKKKV